MLRRGRILPFPAVAGIPGSQWPRVPSPNYHRITMSTQQEPQQPATLGIQHIVSLTAENVKKVVVARVEPGPNNSLVVIGGRNAQGKTSLLDAIEMAIGGGDAIPARPIREGASKARIVLETEDFTVTRSFSPKGNQLVVSNRADGSKVNSPQGLLDSLTNRVAFDPLSFIRLKADKQAETLRQLVGIDFTGLEAEHATKYAQRTALNRDVKAKTAALDALPRHPGIPKEPVSATELTQQLEEAIAHNAANERAMNALADLNDGIDTAAGAVDKALEQVKAAHEALMQAEANLSQARSNHHKSIQARDEHAEATKTLEDKDVMDIRLQIAAVDETNAKVRQNQAWQEASSALILLTRQSQELTDRLAKIEEEKETQLAKAKFPIEGLSFTSEGITYEGIPFEQVNTASQLRVSVAIAFAAQPRLKVALVRNGGNDLDTENLALLAQYVGEAGAQLWLERVGTGPEVSVVMEDGEITEDRTDKK